MKKLIATAALLLACSAQVALAQETPPSEYGQGAGVARARSLPQTGQGVAAPVQRDMIGSLRRDEAQLLWAALAAGGVFLAGGTVVVTRRRPQWQ